MANSRYIASLVGPTLVAVTASEFVNPHVWDAIIAPVTYQAGMLMFVGGLSIVRAHNRWVAGWPVVLTLVGWFGIAAGLARMFLTSAAQQSAPSMAVPFELGLMLVGLFLTVQAFRPEQRKMD